MIPIQAQTDELAGVLGLPVDRAFKLEYVAPLEEARNRSVVFLNKVPSAEQLRKLLGLIDCLFFVEKGLAISGLGDRSVRVEVERPRLSMARVLVWIEANGRIKEGTFQRHIAPSARISPLAYVADQVHIGDGVEIGPFCTIGPGVEIGAGSIIKTGAKLVRNVRVGTNCLIRENSVLGGNGFGIEKDEYGRNLRIPHLGGVILGDEVEIGALNSVCSGTLSPTVVQDRVKTDDHVHIAHNLWVGKDSIITAGVIFSGSVRCEGSVWIGPNSSIIQGAKLGEGAFVGIGAVVTKSVEKQLTVAGNPAKAILELKKINAVIAELIRKAP
jgi:UDP-3-O-[3-hydroxymyristoyl] glucosamine N-acyltransferase LpxD